MRFAFFLQLICLITAFQTGISRAAEAPTKMTICIPAFREEFLSLSLLAAKDQGIFAKNGLDVQFVVLDARADGSKKVTTTASKKSLRNMANMMSDYGVAKTLSQDKETCSVGTSVIEHFLNHDDEALSKTQPIMMASYGKDYDTNLIVSAKSKIKTVKDLQGRKIRLGQAPTYLAMEVMMKAEGLSMADFDRDSATRSTEVLAKLESGAIDAAITYVPSMPYMLASGKVRVLKENIVQNYVGGVIPHSLLIAKKQFAQNSPAAIKALISSIQAANEYFARNPSEVIYTLQRHAAFLQVGEWKISKVIAERAGAFVGKVSTVDLFTDADGSKRRTALQEMNAYRDLLVKADFLTEKANLGPWLGLAPTETKVSGL
jgi:ABC-type nitrate/sulfonate/bicarbonate transport system substrate-binding protein